MKTKAILQNYLFILPAVLIFFIFYIYPFYKVFTLSLCQWDGISQFNLSKNFIGLGNFIELLQDRVWWGAMLHAGYITLIALTFQNALALLLAIACDRDIKGGNIYRVIFYLPPVLSEVVVGLVWKWIYDGNYGLLNHWLASMGFSNLVTDWLSNPNTALTAVAIIHCWKGFGWGFIIFLAGLQTIPRQLYETARVDGASGWQVFKCVTIPLMVPVFILVFILTVLGTMQVFVLILSMTNGGPGYHTEVPVTRILASMVDSSRFGYACGQGIMFGAVLLAISFVQIKLSKYMKQA